MTKPEIEKLALEYKKQWNRSDPHEISDICFKAGYLKGIEMERKRCLEICKKEISNWYNIKSENIEAKSHIIGRVQMARELKEQIERGNDE